MKSQDKKYIMDSIKSEGFDDAMRFYSEFVDVKDKKFHELRDKYLQAAHELEEYIFKPKNKVP